MDLESNSDPSLDESIVDRRSSVEENNRIVQQNTSEYVTQFIIKKYILLCNLIDFCLIFANIIVMAMNSSFINETPYHYMLWYLYFRTGLLIVNLPISMHKYFKSNTVDIVENRYVYNRYMNILLVIGVALYIYGILMLSYLPEDFNPALMKLIISNIAIATIIYSMPILAMCCLCCCLPCIVVVQLLGNMDLAENGATEEDMDKLVDYVFDSDNNMIKSVDYYKQRIEKKINLTDDSDTTCCICLTQYENKERLRLLDCDHHFHQECCDKWLKINKTCPLCRQPIDCNDLHSGTTLV